VPGDAQVKTETIFSDAQRAIDAGFSCLTYRIGSEWTWDGVTPDRFLGLAAELAQEVDGRLRLAVDANCRLDEEQAMAVALGLDKLGYAWFEEPILHDADAYARINSAVGMSISGGEAFTTLEAFRPFLEKPAVDIVQPDAAVCGISECLRIGQMAQRYGVDLIPHSWHNGLMCVEHAHMVAALPNPRLVELCVVQGPLTWEILTEKPLIENGWISLSDAPGFGVELAPDLEQRFPYVEGHFAVKMQR
jgi:L-alanine-DL-glutamate epimerase-like enolase superfamily enzyme